MCAFHKKLWPFYWLKVKEPFFWNWPLTGWWLKQGWCRAALGWCFSIHRPLGFHKDPGIALYLFCLRKPNPLNPHQPMKLHRVHVQHGQQVPFTIRTPYMYQNNFSLIINLIATCQKTQILKGDSATFCTVYTLKIYIRSYSANKCKIYTHTQSAKISQ